MGQNISLQCVTRHRANSSSYQNRDKMNMDISNDIWLDALKFLTCPQWSQKRYVCRQMNGIIETNISYLPKMVFACADMYYCSEDRTQEFEKRRLKKCTVIAFDTVIQAKQLTQWFEKRGFKLKYQTPVNIPADDLFIAAKWTGVMNSNLNICIHGSAQETIPYIDEEKRFPLLRKPVLFYAQFSLGSNQNSWNYLAQFLEFIYHPMTYIKEVKMFAVNQSFIDSIKCNIGSIDNKPRYIRCESFSLKGLQVTNDGAKINTQLRHLWKEMCTLDFPKLLKWLTRNVRTQTLNILLEYHLKWFDSLTYFSLDPSGAKECASNKVKINVHNPVKFLNHLKTTFRTSPLVEGCVPTIEFLCPCRDVELEDLGPNLIDQEGDSMGAYALYMISNEKNRMQISLCKSTHPNCCDCKIRIYSI